MAKRQTKEKTRQPRPRIIKLAEVYERQIGADFGLVQTAYDDDKVYFDELDRVLDDLFEEAESRGWEWRDLANATQQVTNGRGLAVKTVENLGERWTKRPQYRTVCLIAAALDRKIELKEARGRQKATLRIAKVG